MALIFQSKRQAKKMPKRERRIQQKQNDRRRAQSQFETETERKNVRDKRQVRLGGGVEMESNESGASVVWHEGNSKQNILRGIIYETTRPGEAKESGERATSTEGTPSGVM